MASGRVITLTGPGGGGKTRLAVEVARDLPGVPPPVFVPLAPVQDDELVASATAVALGVREQPGRPPLDVVVDHLAEHPRLLLLDNCEHVLGGVRSLVTRLLHDARGVAVLATSREPLRLPGEQVWPVAPLAVPGPKAEVEEVGESPSGRLFLDRARQVRPDFAMTPETAGTVAVLCRRLGGLPLAIELIAPWVRALGITAIAARVDELVRMPGSDADGQRHHSIEAALDWSLELLTPAQRALFRRLSVFAGTFSLEAGEAIAGDLGESALQTLIGLVDKGLVLAADGAAGRTRYRLLEPIRQ